MGPGKRLHPGRPHQLRRRHRPAGDADQLFRAAGRRLDRRDHRWQTGHLHRAGSGRRNHAPWRRGRLRFFLDPSARRACQGHPVACLRPGFLHARLRPLLRNRRIGRRPPRRANGRAALRPPRHRGLHPRQGPRRPDQLQHLHRRHRRLHGSRRWRCRRGTGAPCRAQYRHEVFGRLPARRRHLGVSQGARARPLGPGHEVHLRPCRAGNPVP